MSYRMTCERHGDTEYHKDRKIQW